MLPPQHYWPFEGLERGVYDLIMADPPWQYLVRSAKGLGKSADRHYATLDMATIKALPVQELAKPDCLLWLWVTAPMLHLQLGVVKAWGFKYVTNGVWVKTTAKDKLSYGGGFFLRNAHENFIIAKRGAPKRVTDVRSVIMAKRREHSRKPDEAYGAAARMRPDVKNPRLLDLFSREYRPGWECWGEEAGKFGGVHDAVGCGDKSRF